MAISKKTRFEPEIFNDSEHTRQDKKSRGIDMLNQVLEMELKVGAMSKSHKQPKDLEPEVEKIKQFLLSHGQQGHTIKVSLTHPYVQAEAFDKEKQNKGVIAPNLGHNAIRHFYDLHQWAEKMFPGKIGSHNQKYGLANMNFFLIKH